MKRLLFLLAFLFSLSGWAQSIHFDSSSQMSYVCIEPIRARFNDTTLCRRLYVRIFNDNLQTVCSLYYELRDSLGVTRARGNQVIMSTDYDEWDGNNEYPFEYTATKLNLELKEEE